MAPNPTIGKQRDPESDEPLLNATEVARWLNLAPGTVRRLVPAMKIGRVYRYRRSDVESYIAGGKRGAA